MFSGPGGVRLALGLVLLALLLAATAHAWFDCLRVEPSARVALRQPACVRRLEPLLLLWFSAAGLLLARQVAPRLPPRLRLGLAATATAGFVFQLVLRRCVPRWCFLDGEFCLLKRYSCG